MIRTKFTVVFALTVLVLAGAAQPAFAGPGDLGRMLNNIGLSITDSENVMTAFAYLAGIFMGVWGIFKFRDHVDNPQATRLSEGVKRLLAGSMFLALPMVMQASVNTLVGNAAAAGGVQGMSNTAWKCGVGCTPAAPASLDEIAFAVMQNVYTPMHMLIGAVGYLGGMALILVGISRMIKSSQEGPRGPSGMGTIMTFLAGGALMASDQLMGGFAASLFGDAQVNTFVKLDADVETALGGAGSKGANAAIMSIESIMVFSMIVGWIAFIRGWFVLKAVADGSNPNVSVMQGVTFLIGGALAVNLSEFINAIQTTLGYNALGFTFN